MGVTLIEGRLYTTMCTYACSYSDTYSMILPRVVASPYVYIVYDAIHFHFILAMRWKS